MAVHKCMKACFNVKFAQEIDSNVYFYEFILFSKQNSKKCVHQDQTCTEDLELSQPEELLPHDLLDFITTIISNCTYDDNSNKKDQRIVLSICQVNRGSN